MKKHLIIILLLSLSLSARSALCTLKKRDGANKSHSFSLSGICMDSAATIRPAKLLFRVFDFYSSLGFNSNVSVRTSKVYFNETFEHNFALLAAENFLTIVNHSPKVGLTMFRIDNTYLIESGDSLHCEIFRDSISFSGKGSEKMNVQATLFKIADHNFEIDQNLSQLKIRLEKIYTQQINYLDQNRSRISPKIYTYLRYQCYGYKAKALIRQIDYEKNYYKKQFSPEARNILGELDQSDKQILNDQAHRADAFMDYLYRRIKFNYYLKHPSGTDAHPIVEMITNEHTGKVRDRLYLIAFADLPKHKFPEVFSYIDGAIENTENNQYRELLINYKAASASAQPAYPFELSDSAGRMVKLSDFKGKVVVMDFWFTGCIPCIALAEQMHKIIPHFKNKAIVFITVNVDSEQEIWKRSLRSGKYTNPENINLFANAFERSAPILNYYNISAYPKLIIIGQDMKIVSSTPVRPTKEQSTHKDFIDLILRSL